MNGSRSAWGTPAKARRTGNPSPSKPRGAVVTERTGRRRSCGCSCASLGKARRLSTVTAGISFRTKLQWRLFPVVADVAPFRGASGGDQLHRPLVDPRAEEGHGGGGDDHGGGDHYEDRGHTRGGQQRGD